MTANAPARTTTPSARFNVLSMDHPDGNPARKIGQSWLGMAGSSVLAESTARPAADGAVHCRIGSRDFARLPPQCGHSEH